MAPVVDHSLFVRAREQPEAFGDVFREYHPTVLRFMARRTLDPDIAADLVAETFAEMLAHIGAFRGSTEEAGRAWMWTIARNKLHRWHHDGQVERKYVDRVGIELQPLEPDEYARIEELADIAELRQVVRAALRRLKDHERQVLELRVVQELSYDEIAVAFSTTTGGARQRLSKALRALSQELDDPQLQRPLT